MSVLSASYAFVGEVGDEEHVVVRLPHAVREVLRLAALLAPLMASNLAAEFSERLVCSDASPFAEGAVAAEVPAALQRELWRHRERWGAYTRVCGQWATQLRLHGLKEEADALEADAFGSSPSPARVLIETFEFVECAPTLRLGGWILGRRIGRSPTPCWRLWAPSSSCSCASASAA